MTHPIPPHGGQLAAVASLFGVAEAGLLDFSANINPDGPPPSVLEALQSALLRPESLTQYPDLRQTELKQALAAYTQVALENVLVANGFAPLLDAAIRANAIRSCSLPIPAFGEYRSTLEQNNVRIVPHTLRAADAFRYDIDSVLATRCDAILLANPQNPTGALSAPEDMLQLVARAAEQNTLVLVDEAFIDYAPACSLSHAVQRFPNLIVFRSLTKCFAIPGLRVAYALAASERVRRIERFLPAWPVSTLASVAAIAAVADLDYISSISAPNKERRASLAQALTRLGCTVSSGAANFLLIHLPAHMDAADTWRRLITEHGVVLRSCENFEGLPPGHLRTAVRDESANAVLVSALAQEIAR